jgi:NADH-quinone oxidoreductase subunit J
MKLKLERGQLFWGGVVSLMIFLLLLDVITNTPQWENIDEGSSLEPTTQKIGEMIMGKWEDTKLVGGEFLLPFEVASILLLVALIGAALISRKEIREE